MLGSNALVDFLRIESKTYGIFTEKQLTKITKALKKSAHEIAYDVLSAEADKLARMVKEEIQAQPPAWPPLNDAYKNWKAKVGLNTDMLRATDAYYNAIAVQEIRNEKGQFASAGGIGDTTHFSIRVGVPYTEHPGLDEDDNQREKDKNITYLELAEILEYGTESIPPRPHWMPTYRRWKSQHARSIKARIKSLVVRRFARDFRNVIVPQRQAKKSK